MFGIGLPEFIIIMAVALIVVGPDKLPDLAKSLAKQFVELKKAASALKDSLQEEAGESDDAPWKQVSPDQYLPQETRVRDLKAKENPAEGEDLAGPDSDPAGDEGSAAKAPAGEANADEDADNRKEREQHP